MPGPVDEGTELTGGSSVGADPGTSTVVTAAGGVDPGRLLPDEHAGHHRSAAATAHGGEHGERERQLHGGDDRSLVVPSGRLSSCAPCSPVRRFAGDQPEQGAEDPGHQGHHRVDEQRRVGLGVRTSTTRMITPSPISVNATMNMNVNTMSSITERFLHQLTAAGMPTAITATASQPRLPSILLLRPAFQERDDGEDGGDEEQEVGDVGLAVDDVGEHHGCSVLVDVHFGLA